MATAIPTNIPKREVYLTCGNYILRTLTPDDASHRWAGWMSEPKNQRLLNAAGKAMTRDANEALTEQHRKILREMAAAWRMLVDEAERKGNSS